MARTIRLNTSSGGAAASGSSGLGQSDVERIIDEQGQRNTGLRERVYILCA